MKDATNIGRETPASSTYKESSSKNSELRKPSKENKQNLKNNYYYILEDNLTQS